MSFYRRLPVVNPRPLGNDDDKEQESYEQMLARSCRRCSVKMTYVEAIGNYICPFCGWQPLLKKKK